MNNSNERKPMGFGMTMLASAVGFVIGTMVMNLIAFIAMLAMMVSLIGSTTEESVPLAKYDLAVELNLTGMVSEAEPDELTILLGEDNSTSMTQMLKAIESAASDIKVNALYIHLGGSNLGWAQAEELRQALTLFRSECDKPVVAWGEMMSGPEYYLATMADQVAVHPSGMIDFRGMGAEAMFYKGLLDKMGVHMELIRPTSCEYKSAGEVYTRTSMSDANREQVRSYISDIWNYAVGQMAENRGLSVSRLQGVADSLTGCLPNEALSAGLVDTLCFAQDMKKLLHDKYNVGTIVKDTRYAESIENTSKKDRIALIYAEGEVLPGKETGFQSAIYGDDMVKHITAAAKDKKVKAIVLRINSPGGAVTASEAITHAVCEAKKEKPVIISMSGVAASAGYEMSCFGSKIVAHPTTLTGSIGVFATIPEVGELLRSKLGITTDTVMTNRNSTGLSISRPLSSDARAMLQRNVEDFYITFTQRVADGRGLDRLYVDSIARGRVWTGRQAKELGLVDTLGGLTLAMHLAAEEAGVDYDECSVLVLPAKKSLWEQMRTKANSSREETIQSRLNATIPFYSDMVKWANMQPLQARLPFAIRID